MVGFDATQMASLGELFENFKNAERQDQTANLDFRFGQQDEKYGAVLQQAIATNEAIKATIEAHDIELGRNAERVSDLVKEANKVRSDVEGMTPALEASFEAQNSKSEDLNGRLVKLTDDMNNYAAEAKAQLEGSQAMVSQLGAGLQMVADQAKSAAMTEINELKTQLQDWARGKQQRIGEGSGGQGVFRDGP